MARILLGVSGGIAAYGAGARPAGDRAPATACGWLMTPAATRFVGAASFEGIVGAPVLGDEFERDPMRGAFPGDPVPAHDPIGHLAVVAQRRRLPDRPGLGQHGRQARGRDRRLDAHDVVPGLHRAARGCPGDERPDVRDAATQANLATLRERGIRVIDPEEGALASRGEYGVGRLPSPERLLAEVEALVGAPSGAVGRAASAGDAPAAPGSRSTRSASSATAPAVAWALRWRSRRRGAGRR